jgi:type IV secretory pathway component VirB8
VEEKEALIKKKYTLFRVAVQTGVYTTITTIIIIIITIILPINNTPIRL